MEWKIFSSQLVLRKWWKLEQEVADAVGGFKSVLIKKKGEWHFRCQCSSDWVCLFL